MWNGHNLHLIVIFYFKAKSIQLLVAAISRSGTDVDAANLYQRFKALDFEVHLFNNQTCQQMMLIMREGESDSQLLDTVSVCFQVRY